VVPPTFGYVLYVVGYGLNLTITHHALHITLIYSITVSTRNSLIIYYQIGQICLIIQIDLSESTPPSFSRDLPVESPASLRLYVILSDCTKSALPVKLKTNPSVPSATCPRLTRPCSQSLQLSPLVYNGNRERPLLQTHPGLRLRFAI